MPTLSSDAIAKRIEEMPAEEASALARGAVVPISDMLPTAEARSRDAFERLNGGPISDSEWAEAERNLDAFMRIAIEWQEHPRRG